MKWEIWDYEADAKHVLSLRERIEVAFERFVPHHPPVRRDVSR